MRVQLVAVMQKELRQTFRDPRMAAVLVVAPVLQLTLLGFAVDLDVDRVPTVVADQDHSPASRAFLRGLLADATLESRGAVEAPEPALERGLASVVVVVPRGFSRALESGRTAEVQILIDGTDPTRAQVATAAPRQYAQVAGLEVAAARAADAMARAGVEGSAPRVEIRPTIAFNPRLRSAVYMVPGVAAMVLLVVTTVVTAMGIAREKELGTIEQLLVTPMRPITLLLGKVLPFAGVGLVVTGVVLAVGTNLFDVPVRGDPAILLVGTILYLLSTLGTGVLISSVARNQQQAVLGGFFFIMPATLLSGFMSPLENMPSWVQPIAAVNPVRYYVHLLRSVLLRAAGWADLAPDLVALAVFGTLVLGLGASRFKKTMA